MIKSRLKILIAEKETATGRKWTYDDIAVATGLAKNTIAKLATNRTQMVSFETLDKLCRFFGCQSGPGNLLVYKEDANE